MTLYLNKNISIKDLKDFKKYPELLVSNIIQKVRRPILI